MKLLQESIQTTNFLIDIQSIAVYGGAGVASQIGDLKRGGEIVVCTPGRMIDILSSNKGNILFTINIILF
jgi:ATP-dependent RNA helicase DDX46/PRP5